MGIRVGAALGRAEHRRELGIGVDDLDVVLDVPDRVRRVPVIDQWIRRSR